MITLDVPPKLILPDHYQANRPAIIRPVGDLASYFPVELNRKQRRAIVAELVNIGAVDDRAKASKLIEAAIPFGAFFPLAAASIVYQHFSNDEVDRTSYTYTAVPLGTAAGNRHILVCTMSNKTTPSLTPTSVTVDGITATSLFNTKADGRTGISSEWDFRIAYVPTGTSVSVVVNYGATNNLSDIVVFACYGLRDAYTLQHSNSTAGATNVTMNGKAGGITIVCYIRINTAAVTWTNATQAQTATITGARVTSATYTQSTDFTARSISVSAAAQVMGGISLR